MGVISTAAGNVRGYWRRRIHVPIGRSALMLDVGSGDHPHWRADVLVDKFPEQADAGQRFRGGAAKIDRPVFVADASAMPFRDNAFDYVNCSHVLEHVTEPDRVAAELSRVARAGYVEVPAVGMAKILDFSSHLWMCRQVGKRIVFEPKRTAAWDPDIEALLDGGLRDPILRVFAGAFDHCVVAVQWTGSLDVEVIGPADPSIATEANLEGSSRRLATSALEGLLRRTRGRRSPVTWNDVVAAEHARADNPMLQRGVYSV